MQRAGAESIVISFAQKTFANGQLTSKLHVIELGAPAGWPSVLVDTVCVCTAILCGNDLCGMSHGVSHELACSLI